MDCGLCYCATVVLHDCALALPMTTDGATSHATVTTWSSTLVHRYTGTQYTVAQSQSQYTVHSSTVTVAQYTVHSTHMHICAYAYTYAHMHTCAHMHTYAHMHAYVHMCICAVVLCTCVLWTVYLCAWPGGPGPGWARVGPGRGWGRRP